MCACVRLHVCAHKQIWAAKRSRFFCILFCFVSLFSVCACVLLLADLDRCWAYYLPLLLVGLLMPLLPMRRAIFKSICSIGWASVRFLLPTKFYGMTYNNKIAGSVRVHFYASLSPSQLSHSVRLRAYMVWLFSRFIRKIFTREEKKTLIRRERSYTCVCVCLCLCARIAIMCIWFGFSSLRICFVHGISTVCLILFTSTQLFSTFCLIIKKANGRIGHK